MNRRNFIRNIVFASAASIFVPKLIETSWKALKTTNPEWVINPEWVNAKYEYQLFHITPPDCLVPFNYPPRRDIDGDLINPFARLTL